jgi:hypothetical protein
MWFRADILGLFSLNVVSFSRDVVLRVLLFSLNSVLKPRMLSVRADYVLSSLQLGSATRAPKRKPTLTFFSSECFQIMPFADRLRIAHSFGKLAQSLFA